jgi:hypothetical protein
VQCILNSENPRIFNILSNKPYLRNTYLMINPEL